MILGISYSLIKDIKHLGFFKEKIVIVNIEFFLYLNPPIFKSRVILLDSGWGLKSLIDFNYFIIIFILSSVLYLVKWIG